jgi:hypothetical protein
MTTRIIIDLAEDDGLGDALTQFGDWYGSRGIRPDGIWVTVGSGNQHRHSQHQFAWRITSLDVQDDDQPQPDDFETVATGSLDPMDTGDALTQQPCGSCGTLGRFDIWLDTSTGYYIVSCVSCGDGFTLDGQKVR